MSATLRQEYRKLSGAERQMVQDIKDAGQRFLDIIDQIPGSREKSLAGIKLEEAVMWAVKGATK